ncbi:B12-binding domain-containing radical SAM protein [Halioglobus japonicus]|nr:radical SAM protein [Halioglobus japonicus]
MTTPRPVMPLALSSSDASLPYLSLGMVASYLRAYGQGELTSAYDVQPVRLAGIPGHRLVDLYQGMRQEDAPVVLLSSYVWNHELNMQAARRIRSECPDALIILGGPEIPKWEGESEAFLEANPAVDVAVLGEGEVACAEVLKALATGGELASVAGLVYRDSQGIHRTADRDRVKDLDTLPSPYLLGEFDAWISDVSTATLETNRGCPYGCTYCDWGSATLQKVSRFSLDRVSAEVEYLAQKKMEAIFIADANFGMLEQDIAIAEALVACRQRYGYPQRLYTNFAKNGGRRLMSVISILNKGGLLPTGIIALQTTDKPTLEAIQRDNIRTASYEKMMSFFNAERIPMASDIMIGLPGQTVDSLEEDLQFCFDWKVSANGNYTSMMPNAPMAEKQYRQEFAIAVDADNMIASTSTFSADELGYMRCMYLTYLLMVRMALLKYVLYYLQIDHGVQALSFLRKWMDQMTTGDERYPLSLRVYRDIIVPASERGHWPQVTWGEEGKFLYDALDEFYAEIAGFTREAFGLELAQGELDAIFAVQCAVNPSTSARYPIRLSLTHDVAAYFEQLLPQPTLRRDDFSVQPLSTYGAGDFVAGDESTRVDSIAMQTILGHSDEGWELPSPLRFH